MGRFNEELVKAGVLLSGEGLQSSAKGVRVKFGGGKSIVTDGPFTETKELIAGFWLWQVKSVEEAVEWIRRSPFQKGNEEIEIRRVFEAEDFGANLTPELRAQEAQPARAPRRQELTSPIPQGVQCMQTSTAPAFQRQLPRSLPFLRRDLRRPDRVRDDLR